MGKPTNDDRFLPFERHIKGYFYIENVQSNLHAIFTIITGCWLPKLNILIIIGKFGGCNDTGLLGNLIQSNVLSHNYEGWYLTFGKINDMSMIC